MHRRSAEGASEPVTVIAGAIFKRLSGYHGRAHEWVAPPAAVQAVAVRSWRVVLDDAPVLGPESVDEGVIAFLDQRVAAFGFAA